MTTTPQAIMEAMRDFYLRAHRELDRLMTRHGASLARTKLLMFIAREDRARSADIATNFGYAPRTVTEAIDGLERDGLVRRESDPSDRRAKLIIMTPAGREAVEKAEPIRHEFSKTVCSVLSEEERTALLAILQKLNAGMGE